MKKKQEMVRLNFNEMKLSHLKRKIMTINNLMYVVAKIMEKHIGLDNAIDGDVLFEQVYGRPRKPDYVDDFRWDYVRKAMHKLRQKTKLFIANTRSEYGNHIYFVPTSEDEAQYYVDRLENSIKSMRLMQKKARKSVNEKWYKLDWIDESKELTLLKDVYEDNTKQITLRGKSK